VSEAWKMKEEADYFIQMDDCQSALNVLTHLIEISPWDSELRQKRSNCYLEMGDSVHAISDLRFTTRLNMDDTDGIYRYENLTYKPPLYIFKSKLLSTG
jgi:DnaJ family protein C protein 3